MRVWAALSISEVSVSWGLSEGSCEASFTTKKCPPGVPVQPTGCLPCPMEAQYRCPKEGQRWRRVQARRPLHRAAAADLTADCFLIEQASPQVDI